MDKDGRMFVNVPWTNVNSSYITSDSDEKLKVETISNDTNYSLLLMKSSGSIPRTATGNINAEFSVKTDGSSYSRLNIGGFNFRGQIGLGYKNNGITYYTYLNSTHTSASRTISFPDKSGTVALTSDIIERNYTATSPIDITNDVISHETSGVTAGTYDGGGVKDSGFYVPSFTVNTTGHVTSATDLGTLIPEVTTSNSSSAVGGVISPLTWSMGLRSYQSSAIIIPAGNTTSSVTISSDSKSGYSYRTYFRVADVQAYDASTYEPVIVDWTTNKYYSGGSTITLTISIASAYTNDIIYYPILTYAVGTM